MVCKRVKALAGGKGSRRLTLKQKSVICEEVGKKGSVIPGKENTLIKDLGIAVIPVILGLHRKGDHGVKTFSKTTATTTTQQTTNKTLYIKHSKQEQLPPQ